MDFKKCLLALALLALSACTYSGKLDEGDENILGNPLKPISPISKQDGTAAESIVIFDQTLRRVHQFNLYSMSFQRSYQVESPDAKHVLINQSQGNYFIDFYSGNMAIYNRTGLIEKNPIKFHGVPLSAAYLESQNLLITYDDLGTVGILKLNSDGQVLQRWIAGAHFNGVSTISSGDLLADGSLVLALKNNNVVKVDTAATLNTQAWVYTQVASGLSSEISWLAPVPDNGNQIFAKAGSELAIINMTTGLVANITISNSSLEKLSKDGQGHVVYRSGVNDMTVYYAENSQIKSKTVQNQKTMIMSSSLSQGTWSLVDAPLYQKNYFDNSTDQTKKDRRFVQFRLQDLLTLQKYNVPDEAQTLISSHYIFSLFPSELGYATCQDVSNGSVKESKFFNVGGMNN